MAEQWFWNFWYSIARRKTENIFEDPKLLPTSGSIRQSCTAVNTAPRASTTEEQGWYVSSISAPSKCRRNNFSRYLRECLPANTRSSFITERATPPHCWKSHKLSRRLASGVAIWVFRFSGRVDHLSQITTSSLVAADVRASTSLLRWKLTNNPFINCCRTFGAYATAAPRTKVHALLMMMRIPVYTADVVDLTAYIISKVWEGKFSRILSVFGEAQEDARPAALLSN